jgi:hypothetical protein
MSIIPPPPLQSERRTQARRVTDRNDYRKKWNVATSTARSQLHNVFDKTSTHRQCDLLRLIFLFTRT